MKNKSIKAAAKRPIRSAWNSAWSWIVQFRHVFWIICIGVSLALMYMLVPQTIWNKLWHSLYAQRFIVCLGLIFIVIALSIAWSVGQRVDVWFFNRINSVGTRSRWLDRLMLGLTQMGNFIFALSVAVFFYVRGEKLFAFELMLGLLTMAIIVQSVKVLVDRKRPYSNKQLNHLRVVGTRNPGPSFPSGHTSQAFYMASLFSHFYHLGGHLVIVLYAIALVVGITRIYVGMHYPRDVIGGAMLGTAWGIIGLFINQYFLHFLKIGL